MKALSSTLFLILLVAISNLSRGQEATGAITIAGKTSVTIDSKYPSVVHHYADFRSGKYPIVFSLKTTDFTTTSDKKEVALVVFQTVVKANGKIISRSKGKPTPYFPGEMGMPIETFDIIPTVFDHQHGSKTPARKGELAHMSQKAIKYEIEISATVLNGNGIIKPAYIVWII